MGGTTINVNVVGFGLHESDRSLICNMINAILGIKDDQVSILDAECYQPTICDDDCVVLVYGARAHKRLLASGIKKNQQPWIVILPDVKDLQKNATNKLHRQKAVEILKELKQQMDKECEKQTISNNTESQFDVASLRVTLKNGQEITVSNNKSADALPEEIQAFLHLLSKLPYREVDIEFIKNIRSAGS